MKTAAVPGKEAASISFDIADLLLAQSWALFHELRMVVELDHYGDVDQFEEAIAFYRPISQSRRWLIWRNPSSVVVQPGVGRSMRFNTLAGALERLIPSPAGQLTDLCCEPMPSTWPG
jgi:hypothetical protein